MVYVWRDRGSSSRSIALEASTRTLTPHYMYYMTATHPPSFIYNNSIFIFISACNIISFTWKCLWTANPPGELELTAVFFTCLSGVAVVQCCQVTYLHVFSSVLWYRIRFPRKNDARFDCTPNCYVGVYSLLVFFVYLFTSTGVQYDFHVRWYYCHLTVTRRMSLVEQ